MNNPLSYTSVKLDRFTKEGILMKPASGFLVEADGHYFLITNWHVLSGMDFPREEAEPGSRPHTLKFSLHIYSGEGENRAPLSWGMWKRLTVPLYEDHAAPAWIEPHNNQEKPMADVAVLPLSENETLRFNETVRLFSLRALEGGPRSNYWVRISAIPIAAIDTNVEYGPGDRVHIVGHPHGWAPNGPEKSSTAFWRAGSIASEIYETGMSRRQYTFFVDPSPPEGMTGSLVLALKNDQLKLLGVYSDSPTADFGANAGLVWDAWLVKELIGKS
jgi:hypothetical protein